MVIVMTNVPTIEPFREIVLILIILFTQCYLRSKWIELIEISFSLNLDRLLLFHFYFIQINKWKTQQMYFPLPFPKLRHPTNKKLLTLSSTMFFFY